MGHDLSSESIAKITVVSESKDGSLRDGRIPRTLIVTDSGTPMDSQETRRDVQTQERQNFWDRLLNQYDLLELVLDLCSPASLFNLAKTCHSYHAALKPHYQLLWDINRHLKRYFSNPIAFRNLQARTATLISGSSALQFLDRTIYDGSDLDLYVYDDMLKEVCEWIMSDGYVFVPRPGQQRDLDIAVLRYRDPIEIYDMPGIVNIIDLVRPEGGPKIQVIAADKTPMQVILGFYSTCVMNVISFEKAYSLYPMATFEKRCSLACAREGPIINTAGELARCKYMLRGWSTLRHVPQQEQDDIHSPFSTCLRSIADRFSWVLPLDTTGVSNENRLTHIPGLSNDPVHATSWQLGYGAGSRELTVVYSILAFPYLRYAYALSRVRTLAECCFRLMQVSSVREPRRTFGSEYWDGRIMQIASKCYEIYSDTMSTVEEEDRRTAMTWLLSEDLSMSSEFTLSYVERTFGLGFYGIAQGQAVDADTLGVMQNLHI